MTDHGAAVAALGRAAETLEPRLFLHAGHAHAAIPLLNLAAVVQPLTVTAPAASVKVTAASPLNGAQSVGKGVNVTVTFDADIDPTSVNADTFELRDGSNAVVPAAVTYNASTRTAVLNPTGNLAAANTYFYARVKGGPDGVREKDTGNYLPADFKWSFTTGKPVFTETVAFDNIDHATAIRFAPDGRAFVAEKSGIVKVFDNLSDTTATTFLDLRTNVHNFWDRGLLGLALSPDFATNPYVYVLYAYDGDVGGPAPKWGVADGDTDGGGDDPTGVGTPASGRLSRFQVLPDGTAGPEQLLIADWPQHYFTHSVGSVAFGPDGALYVSVGDSSNAFYADYGQKGGNPFNDPPLEGGALRSQDVRTPNDPTTLDGTVIRIDPATAAALPSNPLYLSGHDANAKRILAYGLRNPYRMTFRPGTSELWIGDVGNTWAEEINRLDVPATLGASAAARNFGWPAYEGMERQDGFENANLPLIDALYAEGLDAVKFPEYVYHREEEVVPGTDEPVGGASISGLAFYGGPGGGTAYPAAYDGALFFCDYTRQRIWVMYKGPDGQPNPASRQLFRNVSGPVDLQTGPNGDLFYVDYNNGTIRRFQFLSANHPPRAAISADATTGAAPLTVRFNAAGSFDSDPEDVLTYAWDLDGDGETHDSDEVAPTFTYPTAGVRTVRLRVTDPQGATDTTTIVINAGNTAPVPTIESPLATLRWKVGDPITFAGAATDLQDGPLAAASLKWLLVIHHDNLTNPAASHQHIVQGFDGVAGGTFNAPDHDYPSRLELRLTATDSGGLSSTTSVILQPMTTTLDFTSTPPGLRLGFNTDAFVTPFTRTVIVGSHNSFSAAATQVLGGKAYAFATWADGAPASRNVVAPADGASYTARYTVPFAANDVTAGLMYRYALDEESGNAAADSAGANNGTRTNGVTWNAPRIGASAALLDGIDDYIVTAHDLAPVLGGTATLAAWIKTTQPGNSDITDAPGLTGVEHYGDGNDVFWGWLDADGRIRVQAGNGASAGSVFAVNDGVWHHVAMTRDATSGDLQVYVDGLLHWTAAGEAGLKTTPFNGIGRIDDDGGRPRTSRARSTRSVSTTAC